MSVYFIAEDFNGSVKIGFATDVDRRIIQLQTGNPRPLMLMAYIKTSSEEDDRKLEKALHDRYEDYKVQKEWYSLSSSQVLEEVKRYPYTGFLAKSRDVLKVVGYDDEGVPEFGEVWAWEALYLDECCPFVVAFRDSFMKRTF